jgi:hypothetical protein
MISLIELTETSGAAVGSNRSDPHPPLLIQYIPMAFPKSLSLHYGVRSLASNGRGTQQATTCCIFGCPGAESNREGTVHLSFCL